MKKVISIVLVLAMACCSLVGSSCFAAESASKTESPSALVSDGGTQEACNVGKNSKLEDLKGKIKSGWNALKSKIGKKTLYAGLAVLGVAGAFGISALAKNYFNNGSINSNVCGLNDENICLPCDYNSKLNFLLNNSTETKVTNSETSSDFVPNIWDLNVKNIEVPCNYVGDLNPSLNNSNKTNVTNSETSSVLDSDSYYQNNEKSSEIKNYMNKKSNNITSSNLTLPCYGLIDKDGNFSICSPDEKPITVFENLLSSKDNGIVNSTNKEVLYELSKKSLRFLNKTLGENSPMGHLKMLTKMLVIDLCLLGVSIYCKCRFF